MSCTLTTYSIAATTGKERTTVAYIPAETSEESRWVDHIDAGLNFTGVNKQQPKRTGEDADRLPVLE